MVATRFVWQLAGTPSHTCPGTERGQVEWWDRGTVWPLLNTRGHSARIQRRHRTLLLWLHRERRIRASATLNPLGPRKPLRRI